ncbi:hypothetical protein BKP64_00900 [Marinobacter salinus]|uniref:DUF1127 domain-containing protein n=1 Tax=Marinobacter salinus TaxID=1874317 RepID=A0A1D9GRF7_9GAMM|nr:hypothetical protein BKP64_00900 [Marinobacter salinus]
MMPLSSWMESYSRRQQFRRIATTLLGERDEIICDLGYSRQELVSALKLPLRSDALTYIEQRRSKRRLAD